MDKNAYFEKIAEYKLLAKHEVGQNFLVDSDLCEKIVSLADITIEDHVLEIGSGAGSLSYFIAQTKGESTLIDIDEGLVTKLQEDFEKDENVKVEQANVMRYDLSSFSKIIGNLPYYITSGIIEKIALGASSCSKAILMVQKEVFPRLNAKLGSKEYGPLPILLQYRGTLKKEIYAPRASFTPMPHVDSLVFSLSFNKNADMKVASNLYSLVSALFLHRRKTISNNLSSYLKDSEKAKEILQAVGIKENRRPEEISLEEYLSLLSRLF